MTELALIEIALNKTCKKLGNGQSLGEFKDLAALKEQSTLHGGADLMNNCIKNIQCFTKLASEIGNI